MIHPAFIALFDVISVGFVAAMCTLAIGGLRIYRRQRHWEAYVRHALVNIRASA